jgi:hypothetical protein
VLFVLLTIAAVAVGVYVLRTVVFTAPDATNTGAPATATGTVWSARPGVAAGPLTDPTVGATADPGGRTVAGDTR